MIGLLLSAFLQPGVVEYVIRVIGPTPATTVVLTATIPQIQVRCGLPKRQADALVINPRAIRWDDPTNDTLDCEWEDATGAALRQLPLDDALSYVVTIRPRYDTGQGPLTTSDNAFKRAGRNPSDPLDNVRLVK